MNPLKLIEHERIARLFHSFYGESGGLAILSRENTILWSENLLVREVIDAEVFALFASDKRQLLECEQPQPLWLIKLPLQGDEEGVIGSVVMIIDKTNAEIQGQDEAWIYSRGDLIVELSMADFEYKQQIDDLSRELSGRNEKMNLVFETDREVWANQAWRTSLQKMAENCTSYLDVCFTAIILDGDSEVLGYKNQFKRFDEEAEFRKIVKPILLPQMKLARKVVLINDPAESMFDAGDSLRELKYLACPIVDLVGEVIGMVMLVNPHYAADFSRGDQNLIEIVARMASRVVLSHHDALTGVLSRQGFETYLDNAVVTAQSGEGAHTVLSVGIQRLHIINETASFEAGDALIKAVARTIIGTVRGSDKVARLGSDEFLVLLEDCPLSRAKQIAAEIVEKARLMEFNWQEFQFETSVSIGVTIIDDTTPSGITVMSSAEIAQEAAQEAGRNRIKVFSDVSDDMHRRREQLGWVGKIQQALKHDGFELFSQKIESTNKLSGQFHQEILLRMKGEEGEVISPYQFLPTAERYHLMPAIDRWVLEKTLKTLTETAAGSIYTTDVIWGVNLSGQTIADDTFLSFVEEQFNRFDIPTNIICFEITETTTFGNHDAARKFVSSLKDRGFRFALDDFGTGLSSFAYLRNFDLDYLKIDGSFVKNMLTDAVCETIVSSTTQIGHAMGLEIIAEFVETEKLANKLTSMGIDYLQGYGIGKPVPLAQVFTRLGKPVRNAEELEV